VSTRNKCFPLDFTNCEKCLVPETGNGWNIGLWNDEYAWDLKAPKAPIRDNCHTRLPTAAISDSTNKPQKSHTTIFSLRSTNRTKHRFISHEESTEVCEKSRFLFLSLFNRFFFSQQ